MDKTTRKIAAAKIQLANVLLVHVWQMIQQVTLQQGAGLTDKENVYLRRQVATMQEVTENVHRVWHRCHHGTEQQKIGRRR